MCVKYTRVLKFLLISLRKIPLSQKIYTSAATGASDKYEVCQSLVILKTIATSSCVFENFISHAGSTTPLDVLSSSHVVPSLVTAGQWFVHVMFQTSLIIY